MFLAGVWKFYTFPLHNAPHKTARASWFHLAEPFSGLHPFLPAPNVGLSDRADIHVETDALVHFSTDAARAYGSDEMVRPGVPGHNAVVHPGPTPVFVEPQRSRVQVGAVIIDFVAHVVTQKLDSLWRWLKRGVETCHRSDRASFMASLRATQYQH
eukprot:6196312-Amphidinium_carterae.1